VRPEDEDERVLACGRCNHERADKVGKEKKRKEKRENRKEKKKKKKREKIKEKKEKEKNKGIIEILPFLTTRRRCVVKRFKDQLQLSKGICFTTKVVFTGAEALPNGLIKGDDAAYVKKIQYW
jgi:DNA-directed RNA polymerase subunit M/transcription elongation factor TFIIS